MRMTEVQESIETDKSYASIEPFATLRDALHIEFIEDTSQDQVVNEQLFSNDSAEQYTAVTSLCAEIVDLLDGHGKAVRRDKRPLLEVASNKMAILYQVREQLFSQHTLDRGCEALLSRTLGQYICAFRPRIFGIASRFELRNSSFTIDDLASEGTLGLLSALHDFKPLQGEGHFIAYASVKIHGAMIDALREKSNLIYVPRSILTFIKQRNELMGQGLRETEALRALRITLDKIDLWRVYAQYANSLSIDNYLEIAVDDAPSAERFLENVGLQVASSEDEYETYVVADEAYEEYLQQLAMLEQLIDSLDSRSADIMRMYHGCKPYEKVHKLKEIADKYHVSESRVCQIARAALRTLQVQATT